VGHVGLIKIDLADQAALIALTGIGGKLLAGFQCIARATFGLRRADPLIDCIFGLF
jgi:hypothetical protein